MAEEWETAHAETSDEAKDSRTGGSSTQPNAGERPRANRGVKYGTMNRKGNKQDFKFMSLKPGQIEEMRRKMQSDEQEVGQQDGGGQVLDHLDDVDPNDESKANNLSESSEGEKSLSSSSSAADDEVSKTKSSGPPDSQQDYEVKSLKVDEDQSVESVKTPRVAENAGHGEVMKRSETDPYDPPNPSNNKVEVTSSIRSDQVRYPLEPEVLYSSKSKSKQLQLPAGNRDEETWDIRPCPSPRFERIHENAKSRQSLVQILDTLTKLVEDVATVSRINSSNSMLAKNTLDSFGPIGEELSGFARFAKESNTCSKRALLLAKNEAEGYDESNVEMDAQAATRELVLVRGENSQLRKRLAEMSQELSSIRLQLTKQEEDLCKAEMKAKSEASSRIATEKSLSASLAELDALKKQNSNSGTSISRQKLSDLDEVEGEDTENVVVSTLPSSSSSSAGADRASSSNFPRRGPSSQSSDKDAKSGGFIAGSFHVIASVVSFFWRGSADSSPSRTTTTGSAPGSSRTIGGAGTNGNNNTSPRSSPLSILRRRASSTTSGNQHPAPAPAQVH